MSQNNTLDCPDQLHLILQPTQAVLPTQMHVVTADIKEMHSPHTPEVTPRLAECTLVNTWHCHAARGLCVVIYCICCCAQRHNDESMLQEKNWLLLGE